MLLGNGPVKLREKLADYRLALLRLLASRTRVGVKKHATWNSFMAAAMEDEGDRSVMKLQERSVSVFQFARENDGEVVAVSQVY